MRAYKDDWKANLQERGREELEKLKQMGIETENV
jgi:hypothetical protein